MLEHIYDTSVIWDSSIQTRVGMLEMVHVIDISIKLVQMMTFVQEYVLRLRIPRYITYACKSLKREVYGAQKQ